MSVTFQQLQTMLQPVSGSISVAVSDLQTPAVNTLFNPFFSNGTLQFTHASSTPDSATQSVIVSGTLAQCNLAGFAGGQVTGAVFQISGDFVTVFIPLAIAGDGWAFTDTFPLLTNNILNELIYDGIVFTFDSTCANVLPDDFQQQLGYEALDPLISTNIIKGLSMKAEISFDNEMSLFNLFVTTPFTVSGPLEIYFFQPPPPNDTGYGPEVSDTPFYPTPLLLLQTASGTTKTIGSYDLPFTFNLANVFQQFLYTDVVGVVILPTGLVSVTSVLKAGAGIQPIPISVLYAGGTGSSVTFQANSTGSQNLTLSLLPQLLNGAALGNLFNPGYQFPALDQIIINNLGFSVSLNPVSLQTMFVEFSNASNWTLFNGLIMINSLDLRVNANFTGNNSTVSAFLSGSAIFNNNPDVRLSASVSLPGLQFSCKLVETGTLNLKDTVISLIGENSIPLPTITGSTFEIQGNVAAQNYSFIAEIEETWPLIGSASNGLVLGNINLCLTSAPTGVSGSIYAQLAITGTATPLNFVVGASYDSVNGWIFSGSTQPGQNINLTALFESLASLLGIQIPSGLPEVDLDELTISYSVNTKGLFISSTISIPSASFDLTDLPLVGQHLSGDDKIALENIQFIIDNMNGSSITFNVQIGLLLQAIVIPLSQPEKTYAPGEDMLLNDTPATYPATTSGVWIDIQRTFGPIELQKIGFSLNDGGLKVLFNASLAVSTFNMSVDGLSMTIPFNSPYVPSFSILGLSLMYTTPSLTISGGFLSAGGGEYAGSVMVKAGEFGFTAMGAYNTGGSSPSFFIFAMVDMPIGGPPFFFVTGFSGGLGINRELLLPSIENVSTFPLVAGSSAATNPFGSNPQLSEFIEVMEPYFKVSYGQYWVAAGISFTSFKMVNSFALLTVAFGTRTQIALLGMSTIALPPDAKDNYIAVVGMNLEAILLPDDGIFSVSALITPSSYVFSTSCHLTGGFAFFLWFGPSKYAGDFVITLGGFNPHFDKPKYYPKVPLLGLNWQVDSNLVIIGGEYFAITPHSIMAGGYLSATWTGGPVKAWFTLYADFMICWQPFHYSIEMGVNFGVSATINLLLTTVSLNVSIGARLSLYGPPFSGEATIDLEVFSFTISFGEQAPLPELTWADFKESFLPPESTGGAKDSSVIYLIPSGDTIVTPTTSIVKGSVSSGLLADLTKIPGSKVDYVVDPQHFTLLVQSFFPCSTIKFNGTAETVSWNTSFGIGPLKLTADEFISNQEIIILKDGIPYQRLALEITGAPAAKGLWTFDTSLYSTLNDALLLTNIAQNTLLTPTYNPVDNTLPVNIIELLVELDGTLTTTWANDIAPNSDPFGSDAPNKTFADTIGADNVSVNRSNIVDQLRVLGFPVLSSLINTSALQNVNNLGFTDVIILANLGEQKILN